MGRFGLWLQRLWARLTGGGAAQPDPPDRNAQLLDHFILQLRDDFLYAQHPTSDEAAVVNQPISDRIAQLLGGDAEAPATDTDATRRRWELAYEIERLLVYIRPCNSLAIEVDRRVDEAKRIGLPSADKYRSQLDAANARVTAADAAVTTAANAAAAVTPVAANAGAGNAPPAADPRLQTAQEHAKQAKAEGDRARRAILAAVLDDLQWQYQKNVLVHSALWDSASNLLRLAAVTTLVVGFPFFCFVFERWTGLRWFSMLLNNFPNYGVYTAMSFGLLGAFFSRLTSLSFSGTMTLEEAESRYSWRSLCIRGVVGASGALLFYFLMRSEIISSIAPDFDNFAYESKPLQTVLVDTTVLLPSKDWSLMVLWSFLAGFSEKLVPDSLSRVEATASGKKD